MNNTLLGIASSALISYHYTSKRNLKVDAVQTTGDAGQREDVLMINTEIRGCTQV